MKIYLKILTVCISVATVFCMCAWATAPENTAAAAILMDADSGRVLYEKNAREERLIASTTKLMTALVAVESHPDLQETVAIKKEWLDVEGSSIYLKEGERLTLETLLYGLLLQSGNDAAVAIAGFCAGDVESFVAWMNQRAKDLGMSQTQFKNPNGLNQEGHYSTAFDMATLARACMKDPIVSKIVATRSIFLEGRSFTNHNKLLWQYSGCVGMKTGYTEMAGRILISSAIRDGQTLIAVTLSDPNDWEDHKNLLDYGFKAYPKHCFATKGEDVARIPVVGSLLRTVPVSAVQEISYPLSEEEEAEVFIALPERANAPVRKGEIAGQMTVSLDGNVIGESYLCYSVSISRDLVKASKGIQWLLNLFRSGDGRSFSEVMLNLEP